MKFPAFALGLALSMAPAAVFGHGEVPAAAHGGEVRDAHGSWVELVISGDQVAVYVMDEHGAPVPATEVTGTATVLVNGQMHKVQLAPASGNELTGKLPVAASGKTVATLSLRIGNKPATARFASAG